METYPSEFVDKVISEYGKGSATAEAAIRRSFSLGNLLSQGVNIDFSPSEVIQLLENGKSDEVINKAKSCINRRELHKKWLSIMMDNIKMIEQEEEKTSTKNSEVQLSRRNMSVNPQFLSQNV